MPSYELVMDSYLYPTPAGAFYAVTNQHQEPVRKFLIRLMEQQVTPKLSDAVLQELTQQDLTESYALLERLQSLGLIQGLEQPLKTINLSADEVLPEFLKRLSGNEKALLVDDNGLYIASSGFHHESAELLGALAAELSRLQSRYASLLSGNLNYQSAAMGVVNAAGHADLGFWPVYIGKRHFMLVLSGTPQLNSNQLVELIWLMISRYGVTD